MNIHVLRLFLFFALAWVIAQPATAADLNVFAAASLSDALQEIGRDYSAQNNDVVHFNFAASSTLARQIKEGAPADVFFSADEAKMDDLAKAGLIVPATRHSLLSNTLVIVVPASATVPSGGPSFLKDSAVRRLALAEPSTVPAGIYARQWLQKIGLWAQVSDKVVPVENVRACLAAVESGNVDTGIVYRTDALLSKKVQIAYEVAAADGPVISYPAAVVQASKNLASADRFAAFLGSPAARAVFARFGFAVAP